ncbi:uncharacterized protein TRIADDRAFT_59571 [Trichoplax adhaerens]|uniref:G-protein coupled receptors family 3 profile domain-containing protein n=1 Tax=Trichoplax adhaerens TaxID=10228 RepID=B3S610_TRIAD|nr:hypothetical protein TRIADDRAFT_59571 [Trichoplax adhaerens]EDV21899.1 hypothetical protein TRIADDRAFT_59571 [Trichoplax adhaerens]|eukprot:XP_002115536.1 hypothetical protein TRIADDRAFT_59571 [Trichoplax adhaerens]
MAYLPGHIMITGLFSVHYNYDPFTRSCRYLNEQSVQWIQAMIYSIDQINNRSDILPNITLGYDIRDTCDSASLGILQAISLIHNRIQYGIHNPSNTMLCQSANSSKLYQPQVVGIIGGKRSRVSIPVASLVGNFDLPQISYSSTSPVLADRRRYKTFYRTVPSDTYQVSALIDIIKHFDWNYISIIAIDDSYGRQGVSEINKQTRHNEICTAVVEYISDPSDRSTISRILQRIELFPKAKAIILFTTEFDAVNIIQEAEKRNLTGLIFIGTDAWSDSLKFTRLDPKVIGGMLGVSLDGKNDPKFDQYLRSRDLCNNRINPWFIEMWKSELSHLNLDTNEIMQQCNIITELHQNYTHDFYYRTSKAAYVMDAVKALAVAVHKALGCTNDSCSAENLRGIDKFRLLEELVNVSFHGISVRKFHFTSTGDGVPKYTIVNLQPDNVDKNRMKFVKIGTWSFRQLSEQPSLEINDSKIIWNGDRPWYDIPSSNCSNHCLPGTVRVINSRETCCWQCFPCSNLSISNETNAKTCHTCSKFYHPNINHTVCNPNQIEKIEPLSTLAIFIYFVVVIALLLTLITWGLFIKYRKTAIVKASNFTVSNLLLFSICYCSLVPILFLLPKSRFTCELAVIGFGSSLTIVMLTIVSKTKTVAKVFNGELGNTNGKKKTYKLLQAVLPISITIAQICVCSVAIHFDPVKVTLIAVTRNRIHLQCSSKYKIAFLLAFAFIALSNLICIYLAFKTRKLPENFNEAKYICFTALIMFCIVVTLIPSFFTTTGPLQDAIAAFGCAAFALAALFCIFANKIYVMLFQPDLNCREQVILSVTNYAFTNVSPRCTPTATPRNNRKRDNSRLNVIESSFHNPDCSSSDADRSGSSSNRSSLREKIHVINTAQLTER